MKAPLFGWIVAAILAVFLVWSLWEELQRWMVEGALGWVATVNVVIWTGLFAFLLYLEKRVRELKEETEKTDG